GGSGDPSPVTAFGTYMGMKAMIKRITGSDSLEGKRVMVQGVGQVGMYLTEHLKKENAKIFISDIDPVKVKKVAADTGATGVGPEDVFTKEVDIYSPCALGATLNDDTIPLLTCSIVAGAANNQLKDEKIHGKALKERNILYTPDFVINAGGLINVYLEHLKEYTAERAYAMAEKIYDNCEKIINISEEKGTTPHEAAIEAAERRIREIGNVRLPL
ncbi:MAG: Glu/Leu/Phe/Val dehydrogenase family protein, partial [Cyclobacteriaceae bacterium]|nr:Glu/Leu/Phe/Val dehydrogenase family protein [Cyclobacteriaceae bacterium]